MNLLTAEIVSKLEAHPINSTDGVPVERKEVLAKFFTPMGSGTWIVFEGERDPDAGWLFFGAAQLFPGCGELGYFTLRELESVGGLVERDTYPPKRVELVGGEIKEVRHARA